MAARSHHDRRGDCSAVHGGAPRADGVLRLLVAVTVAVTAVAVWRGSHEVFMTVKATCLWAGAAAVVVVVAWSAARRGSLHVPLTWLWWPVGLFVAGLTAATFAASNLMAGMVGAAGRYTGLGLYLACVVLFAAGLRLWHQRLPTDLVAVVLVTTVPVVAYALAQAAGADPWAWQMVEGGPAVFATLGNAGFLSAWMGIVTPLCMWAVVAAPWRRPVRAGAALLGVAAMAAAAASGSLQGPATALVGSAPLLAVWVGRSRQRLAGVLAAVAAAGVAALPTSVGDHLVRSLTTRTGKWQAAWAMIVDHPLRGVGPAAFGDAYPRYAPVTAAEVAGRSVDAAHNVPLHLMAVGGFPTGVGYLLAVAATAGVLVVGLRHTDGQRRTLLAALGGAWVAYQLQSLVSIDVPPLAVLHWLLAAAIVATAGAARWRRWSLHAPGRTVAALCGVVGCLLLAATIVPLRADLLAGTAGRMAAQGRFDRALVAARRAGTTAPWEVTYALNRGGIALRAGNDAEALAAYEEAVRREPHNLAATLGVARLALAHGDHATAAAAYERALQLAPRDPAVVAEAAAASHHAPRLRACCPAPSGSGPLRGAGGLPAQPARPAGWPGRP